MGISSMADKIADQTFELIGVLRQTIFHRRDGSLTPEFTGRMAVLFTLAHRGRCQMSELGKYLAVSRPNISFLVERLTTEGLTERVLDETDRRVIYVQLTSKGRELLQEKKDQIRERIKQKLSILDPGDITELHDAMRTMLNVFIKLKG